MKDYYEVTIGIPVYRSVKYIKETMYSALSQTFPDIEFLIVDDCGNDGSMDVIKLLQSSHPRGGDIRVLCNVMNQGVSFSRNLIIDEARGRFLYFMDSDDIIEPQTIQVLYNAVVKNQAEIAYGSYDIIDKVNLAPTQAYQKEPLLLSGENELAIYAFKHNNIFHVSTCNNLVNLDFLRHTGIRYINVSYWEDMAFTTEFVTKVSRAILLPDITYHYMLRPGSLSHYQPREQLQKEEIYKNIVVLDYLKNKSKGLIGLPYLPHLCYYLEMNSFYVVCHVIKNRKMIVPKMSYEEIRHILFHPMAFMAIINFRHHLFSNLVFWLVGKLPLPIFVILIWLMGKIKKAI